MDTLNGLARNKLKALYDGAEIQRIVKDQSIPDSIKYEEPLSAPTIAGGMISIDPTDYLLGMPLVRKFAATNRLIQLAAPERQSGFIDPELGMWGAAGLATPAIGYGIAKMYSR